MPKLGETAYFNNCHKKKQNPCVIYMDFKRTLYKAARVLVIIPCTIKTNLHTLYVCNIYIVSSVGNEDFEPIHKKNTAPQEEELEKVSVNCFCSYLLLSCYCSKV